MATVRAEVLHPIKVGKDVHREGEVELDEKAAALLAEAGSIRLLDPLPPLKGGKKDTK